MGKWLKSLKRTGVKINTKHIYLFHSILWNFNSYFDLSNTFQLKNKIIVGQVADDFGLTKLFVVYYPKGNVAQSKKGVLPLKNGTVDQFIYSFPNGLTLDNGLEYEYYFEVFDNDAVNGLKSSKSSVYLHYELTNSQKEDKQLKEQQENINSLEKSLKNQDKQFSELDKLEKLNKEKWQI